MLHKKFIILIFLSIPTISTDIIIPIIYIPHNVLSEILKMLPKSHSMPFLEKKWLKSRSFDGWSISTELYDLIKKTLPEGKIILELGSGWASGELSKLYTVYSVEHNHQWLGKFNTNYIYAPIKNRWYDADILNQKLPTQYDLILVDGPPGFGPTDRNGFFTNLDLFKTNVPIIFDDIDRKAEYTLMTRVAQKLGKNITIFSGLSGKKKKFGLVHS